MSDPTKSAILHQSSTGWSPLRINKRSPASTMPSPADSPTKPSPAPGAPRRSSASFAHLRSHSLVSNSPFKSPTSAPEGPKHRPQSTYAGLGITLPSPNPAAGVTRRVTPRRALGGVQEEGENEDPLGPQHAKDARIVKPRKSRGLQELRQAAYVSRSPFLPDGTPSPPTADVDKFDGPALVFDDEKVAMEVEREEMENGLPSPVSPNTPAPPPVPPKPEPQAVLPTPSSEVLPPIPADVAPPPRTSSLPAPPPAPPIAVISPSPTKKHPSLSASPRRPALTSHRLHGPRTNSTGPAGPAGRRVSSGRGKRRRRKTVTWDEKCDVLEFEREEGEEDWEEGEEGEEGEWEEDGEWDEEEGEDGLRVRNFSPADTRSSPETPNTPFTPSPQLEHLVEQLVNESPLLAPDSPYPSPLAPALISHPPAAASVPPTVDAIREEEETELERMERDVEAILASAGSATPGQTEHVSSFVTTTDTSLSIDVSERDVTSLTLSTIELTRSSIASNTNDASGLGESFVQGAFMGADPSALSDGDVSRGSMIFHPSPPGSPDPMGSPFRTPTASRTRLPTAEPTTPTRKHADSPLHTPANASPRPRELVQDAEDGVPLGRTHHLERARWAHHPHPSPPARSSPAAEHERDMHTPVNASPLPRELAQDAEDGVPLGRTHHVERARWAHHPSSPEQGEEEEEVPSLPAVGPGSPFVHGLFASLGVSSPTPAQAHSPRITREDIRARLALGRLGRGKRPSTPTSPSTSAASANTTPTLFSPPAGGESPVVTERAAPVQHGVEVVNPPSPGAALRLDKELPVPPPELDEGKEGRPELVGRGSKESIVGQKSGLERLVEGVREKGEELKHEKQKSKRVPVPPVDTVFLYSPPAQQQPTPTLVPPTTPKMERSRSLKERQDAIIATRREMRARGGDSDEDEGSDEERRKKLKVPKERPARRRSLSTGDVQEEKEPKIDDEVIAALADQTGFFDSVEREVQKLHQPARSYQIREHQVHVFTSPREKVSHVGRAGDVDSGRAWRTVRRPSDMNEYAKQIREYRAAEKPGKALGKVFVRVLSVKSINVPLPQKPAYFTITLNNGIHAVTTPEAKLGKESSVEQEFELIEHSKLEFTLTLKVRKDEHIMAALRPPPQPVTPPQSVAPSKATTPTHKSAFRALFGSPKKARQQPLPSPAAQPTRSQSEVPVAPVDCLARYLGPDGTLAQAAVSFREIAKRCDTRLLETSYPLVCRFRDQAGANTLSSSATAAGGKQKAVGEIVVQFFRLPALPGIEPEKLPQSLEECHRGLRHVAWHKAVYHEGVLTQNGGDCSTWRRRRFRVVGANMIAFNDVTKKVTATIELKKAVSLEDDQDPLLQAQTQTEAGNPKTTMTRSFSSDDNLYSGVQRSFRILFEGGDEISFFADTDEEKAKWLEVLRALIGRIPDHPLWAELVWQRQDELAKQAASAKKEQTQQRKR